MSFADSFHFNQNMQINLITHFRQRVRDMHMIIVDKVIMDKGRMRRGRKEGEGGKKRKRMTSF